MAFNVEVYTVTQCVIALVRPTGLKALESFAKSDVWHAGEGTVTLPHLIEEAPGRIGHGFHVLVVDNTKVHRSSEDVWDNCTFHEYTARGPNRATTVRPHNRAGLEALLHEPQRPAWLVPISGRLYSRKSQLRLRPGSSGATEPFCTTCELGVALVREQAAITGCRRLADFDSGFALKSVIRPLILPEEGQERVKILTRQ